MGQMDFMSSIFVRFFFFKIIWEACHDHTLEMYMLISPDYLCILLDSQTVETRRSACIFMCRLVMLSFSKVFWDKQCNF